MSENFMKKPVSILLVGVGGYGNLYVNALLDKSNDEEYKIAGIVDPKPEECERLNKLKEMGIPIFSCMEDFYVNDIADLAVISTPIQFHHTQTCLALSHGSNVLCEKPACATIQDLNSMIEARNRAEKFVAIGFQWSYCQTIQDLKSDILRGDFGRPKRLKTIVLWPRDKEYYNRGWAGRKRDKLGNWVLDSVASNATAHYLHNMFYITGYSLDRSAKPITVEAELYKVNDIENFDTAAIRVELENNIEVYYFATHATIKNVNPTSRFEFEKGTVEIIDGKVPGSREVIAYFKNGTIKEYGNPNKDSERKLWVSIDAVNTRQNMPCGLEAARTHVLCINGAQESVPEISAFPDLLVKYDEAHKVKWVEGLSETFLNCYEDWKLPHEAGVPWAKAGRVVNLEGYKYFNG